MFDIIIITSPAHPILCAPFCWMPALIVKHVAITASIRPAFFTISDAALWEFVIGDETI